MCWIMIRQYALQNDGAIFPSYDELQKLLSSPGSGQASRDTVSRALTMLRLTGWLSLCKRVRDNGGRVSRESVEYFSTQSQAEHALKQGTWSQREQA